MANLDGIIPALPSGGTFSDRQSTKNGKDYNVFAFDPNQANQAIFNQTGQPGMYNTPGFLYGYGDPNDPAAAKGYQFSQKYDPFMLPDKITPSQYTMTPGQSVGAAQFQMGGQIATAGSGNQSSPFTQSAPSIASTTEQAAAPTGFYFGNKFVPGSTGSNTSGQSSPFYQQQPTYNANQNLGIAQPWDPKQAALIQSR